MTDLRDSRTRLFDARDRLRGLLASLTPQRAIPAESRDFLVDDECLLGLLEHVVIADESDEKRARLRYLAAAQTAPAAPSFDELHSEGWFQILLGRMVTTTDISLSAGRGTSLSPPLAALIRGRFEVAFDYGGVPRADPALDRLAGQLEREELRLRDIGCRRPSWVAARLWERRPASADPLRWWLDRWALLDWAPLSPLALWDAATAAAFHSLVLDRIDAETAIVNTASFRQAIAVQEARGRGRTGPAPPSDPVQSPEPLVARARWLRDPALEYSMSLRHDAFEEVRHLLGLVLEEVEHQRHVPAPSPLMQRLLDVAIDKPDLLHALVGDLLRNPSLVAELLVNSRTCALGCWALMIGPTLRDNRELKDASLPVLQQAALQAGLEMLARFLVEERSEAGLTDAAALLEAAFEQEVLAGPRANGRKNAGRVLDVLTDIDGVPAAIANWLAKSGFTETLDDPAFLAALELAAATGLDHEIAPAPFCDFFIDVVTGGHTRLSSGFLSPAGAAALFGLAQRCGQARLTRFLYPIDYRERLNGLAPNDYEGRWNLSRGIEVTTRVFARAVEELGEDAPDDLVQALGFHIRAGARDDISKGQLRSFGSPPLPGGTVAGTPAIGVLLGAAATALDPKRREVLLDSCLQLEEPAILADLHRAVPPDEQPRVAARITELPIADARPVYSLDTIHARIDSLLDAGLAGPAADYIKAEKQQATRGAIPGRPRIQLGHELRLHLLTGNVAAVRSAQVPPGLPQHEQELCRRMLDHFRALAALQDEGFDPAASVEALGRLVRDNPQEPGYRVNLFAARIAELLGTKNFAVLPRSERPAARRLVNEVEQWLQSGAGASEEDRQICSSNLAMLDLALGQPRRALARLLDQPAEAETATRAAYLAVAQARLGRSEEGHAVLDNALTRFGSTALLEAARVHLVDGIDAGGLGLGDRLLLATPAGQLHQMRSVMTQFSSRPASEQAAILRGTPQQLTALIVDEVDHALAAISSLAPLLNRGVIPDDEDDITSLLKPILNAKLAHLGWWTSDQSKGGYTPRGNYGERDIILVQGNRELAVMEAVIASGSIPYAQLSSHFRKLVGYGDCAVYFHLTYAWLPDMDPLLKALEKMASAEAPPGYAYQGKEARARTGNGARGFTASYSVNGQRISVVFLILDLGQQRLRDAATSAAQKPNQPTRKARTPRAP